MKAQRPQIQSQDAKEPERLRVVLNQALLELCARLEALESAKGITVLPEVEFMTGGTLAPTSAPFANGGVRAACPFTPTGLVLLRLQPVITSGAGAPTSSLASDVKWRFSSGPQAEGGVVVVDFVTGLAVNTRYSMRLGVTRA